MNKWTLFIILILFMPIGYSSFTAVPLGNFSGVGLYNIDNFTSVSAQEFCDLSGQCGTISDLLNGSINGSLYLTATGGNGTGDFTFRDGNMTLNNNALTIRQYNTIQGGDTFAYTNPALNILRSSSSLGATMFIGNVDGGAYIFSSDQVSGGYRIYSYLDLINPAFVIRWDGKTGINKTVPLYALDVGGTLHATRINLDDLSGLSNASVNHSTYSDSATAAQTAVTATTASNAVQWDGETSQANLNVNSTNYWDGITSQSGISITESQVSDLQAYTLNRTDVNFTKIIQREPLVNVESFGVYGDGVTDYSTKVTEALSFARQKGYWLYFPAGTYVLNSGVTIYPGTKIIGDGNSTVLYRSAYTTGGMISGTYLTDVKIYNLDIETGSSSRVGYAMVLYGSLNSYGRSDIELNGVNVYTNHAQSSGISMRGSTDTRGVTIKNTKVIQMVVNSGSTITRGIIIGADSHNAYETVIDHVLVEGFTNGIDAYITGTVQDSEITSSTFRGADRWGAKLYHAGDLRVDNSVFENNEVGAWFDNSQQTYLTSITNCKFLNNSVVGAYSEEWTDVGMTNCLFKGNGYGFWAASGDNVNIDTCRFINNSEDGMLIDRRANLTGSGTNFYDLSNPYYILNLEVKNCIFSQNGKNGVTVGGVQRYSKFEGNSFNRNGLDASTMASSNYSGLYFKNDSYNKNNNIVIIRNNVIGNTSGLGGEDGKQKYGIWVKDPTSVNRMVLGDNDFLYLQTALRGSPLVLDVSGGNEFVGVDNYSNIEDLQDYVMNGTSASLNSVTMVSGYITQYLYRTGDGNTAFRFPNDDRAVVQAGGSIYLDAWQDQGYVELGNPGEDTRLTGGINITDGNITIQGQPFADWNGSVLTIGRGIAVCTGTCT